MNNPGHITLNRLALGPHFGPAALQAITAANLQQDRLRGQIGHPEYHFDDCRFAESYAYIERQERLLFIALDNGQTALAWAAFGRLIHCAQDFYAHTNYVRLWSAREQAAGRPSGAAHIPPLDPELLGSPRLVSGRVFYRWEILSLLPGLRNYAYRHAPAGSHTAMNLDHAGRGPFFALAMAAAERRT
ncbi:MAG: hypothetical protein ACKOC5_08350, partial [Chloroflexota bacterium]